MTVTAVAGAFGGLRVLLVVLLAPLVCLVAGDNAEIAVSLDGTACSVAASGLAAVLLYELLLLLLCKDYMQHAALILRCMPVYTAGDLTQCISEATAIRQLNQDHLTSSTRRVH
jgi:hypothetical protein